MLCAVQIDRSQGNASEHGEPGPPPLQQAGAWPVPPHACLLWLQVLATAHTARLTVLGVFTRAGSWHCSFATAALASCPDVCHRQESSASLRLPASLCVAGQASPLDVDIVAILVAQYGDPLRKVHAEEAPGGRRKKDTPLEVDVLVSTQMQMVGRDRSYECLVARLAKIYQYWQERSSNESELELRRKLAHLLLLSSPGTGRQPLAE